MKDPAVYAIENFVLTAVTVGMALMFLIFLATIWTDREYEIGRDPDGRPRVVRPVRRR